MFKMWEYKTILYLVTSNRYISVYLLKCSFCVDVIYFYRMFILTLNFFLCRYKRVFSVGTHAITTYNPNTLEVTNQVIMLEAVRCLNTIWILKVRVWSITPWPETGWNFRIEMQIWKRLICLCNDQCSGPKIN